MVTHLLFSKSDKIIYKQLYWAYPSNCMKVGYYYPKLLILFHSVTPLWTCMLIRSFRHSLMKTLPKSALILTCARPSAKSPLPRYVCASLHTLHCIHYITLHTLHTLHYIALHTLHCIHYIAYITLHTLHYIHYIAYITLHTLHCIQHYIA